MDATVSCRTYYSMICFVSVFQVSVTVKNAGSVSGDDAVLLFATDVVRRVTPRYKLLKAFDKVSLHPGDSKEVTG